MNIAFLNQNALVQRETIAALRRLPNTRVVAIDVPTHPSAEQVTQVVTHLRRLQSALVITINEWGMDDQGILWEYMENNAVLHINWTVDDPYYEETMHTKKYRPSSFRIDFVSDMGYLDSMRRKGYTVHFLPLATDPALFHPIDSHERQWQHDVVFVGNSYFRQIDRFLHRAPEFIDHLAPYLGEVVTAYMNDMLFDVEGVLVEKLRNFQYPSDLSAEQALFIAKHTAGYFVRKRMIHTLIDRFPTFFVYGESGWLQELPPTRLGTAKYYDNLCSVYQSAKITLDINRVVIRNGFTQRVFDAPASGSFLITSAKSIVYDTFVTSGAQQEIAVFRNCEELFGLVEYYLKHDREREAIAQRGQHTVTARHTYDHRIAEMFSVISSSIK